MHSVDTIEQHGGSPVSTRVLDQTDTSIRWKECSACFRIRPYNQFQRDASYREGVRDQCTTCQSAPALSTEEHTFWLREKNNSSFAVKKQQWANQDDYRDDVARIGRVLPHGEFLGALKRIASNLFIIEGRIIGDWSLYRTYGCPQEDGKEFRYLGYCPGGWLNEFSQYEFDHRDIPLREKCRGWRTVLLRFIRAGLVTPEQCDKQFGEARGIASTVYRRTLYNWRNGR